MRLRFSGYCALALVGLVVGVVFAGKGGNGGGKPGGGDPPADPAIVFRVDDSILVINEDGSNDTAIASGGAASWSLDGSQIAFARAQSGVGHILYVVNADGTGEAEVAVLADVTAVYGLAWSPGATPDGEEKIAFCGAEAGAVDLYVVNLDGSGLTNLTDSSTTERWPTWSPDADAIALLQQNPKTVVVHSLGVDGTSLEITSSVDLTASGPLAGANLNMPAWAKTQDQIAVYAGAADAGDLWIIPVASPADAYLALSGDTSSAASTPSWSPDDSQILYGSFDAAARRGGERLRVLTFATGATETIYQPRRGNLGGADWRR
jgi:dipeptidyl aminopeptidase/acylaminoacyl peptidase